MPHFRIEGMHRKTGESVELTIQAASSKDARTKAKAPNVHAKEIVEIAEVEVEEATKNSMQAEMEALRTEIGRLTKQIEQLNTKNITSQTNGNTVQTPMSCPKCGSTALVSEQRGYSLKKGIVGMFVLGPMGLITGQHGASATIIRCTNCGHSGRA